MLDARKILQIQDISVKKIKEDKVYLVTDCVICGHKKSRLF